MARQRVTIADQIKTITRVYPKRNISTGQLYRTAAHQKSSFKKITLYGLFASDEGSFLLRPHVFATKKKARNPVQWEAWLGRNYGSILPNILNGMDEITGKHWRIYRIIGWVGGDHTRIVSTKTSKKRNKTKRKGR